MFQKVYEMDSLSTFVLEMMGVGPFAFLAIFWNEITTILTPSTSDGVSEEGGGGHVFRFGGL